MQYAAPEILNRQGGTLKSDIFSLGMVLWAIWMQKEPTLWDKAEPPDACPEDLKRLMGQCLKTEPRERPTALEALQGLKNIAAKLVLQQPCI